MSDDLDAIRVLTRPETLKAVGLSDATFTRLEAIGDVPPKTRLSQYRVGYRVCYQGVARQAARNQSTRIER
jgi:predicted DNA-binding transcriptional regulator AlpA